MNRQTKDCVYQVHFSCRWQWTNTTEWIINYFWIVTNNNQPLSELYYVYLFCIFLSQVFAGILVSGVFPSVHVWSGRYVHVIGFASAPTILVRTEVHHSRCVAMVRTVFRNERIVSQWTGWIPGGHTNWIICNKKQRTQTVQGQLRRCVWCRHVPFAMPGHLLPTWN